MGVMEIKGNRVEFDDKDYSRIGMRGPMLLSEAWNEYERTLDDISDLNMKFQNEFDYMPHAEQMQLRVDQAQAGNRLHCMQRLTAIALMREIESIR